MRMVLDLINGRNNTGAFEVFEVANKKIGNSNGFDKTSFATIFKRSPSQMSLFPVVNVLRWEPRNSRPVNEISVTELTAYKIFKI